MKRRSLCILVMMSVFTTLLLSGCTTAGIECGLIGKWEYFGGHYKLTFEFTNDDRIIEEMQHSEFGTSKSEGTIKSVKNNTIEYTYKGNNYEIEYRNLARDSVEFGNDGNWAEFTRVY